MSRLKQQEKVAGGCFSTVSSPPLLTGFLDQLSGRPQAQHEQVRNLVFSVHPSTFSGEATPMHSHFLHAGAASSTEDVAKSNVHVHTHTHVHTWAQTPIHMDTHTYTHRHRYTGTHTKTHTDTCKPTQRKTHSCSCSHMHRDTRSCCHV